MGFKALTSAVKSPVGRSIANTAKDAAVNIAADLIEGKSVEEATNRQLQQAKSSIAKTMRSSTSKNVPGPPKRKRKRRAPSSGNFNIFQ